ncbi:hypothetical protein FOF48_03800 [Corallococcus sp. Z5C101001]|nr:hypothetical protein FOF48_03800 [Corallococcus sp. Z5C101001]
MEAALKRSYPRNFPTHSLYWFVGGGVLIYVVAAAFLAPTSVRLLPLEVIQALFHDRFGPFILLFGAPCGIYLIGWRADDLFVWMVAPRALTLDDEGLRDGDTRVRWRDVREIVEQPAHDRVVLRHAGGRYRLRLGLWGDSEELHQEVQGQVVSRLLERVHLQVAAGQEVRFGPLTLGDAGLTHKGRLLTWEDIESIRLQDEVDHGVAARELVIVAQGRTRKFDTSKIVNAPVLLAYLSDRLAG